MDQIRYNPAASGVEPTEISDQLVAARDEVLSDVELWQSGSPPPKEKQPLDAGFIQLPERLLAAWRKQGDASEVGHIRSVADRLASEVDRVVVLGIGGSYMGARALMEACSHPYHNQLDRAARGPRPQVFFEGNHVARYSLLWSQNNWVKYGPWLAEPRKPAKYEGEKLLIRKIVGKTLIASYYPETSYCNTLLYVLKLKSEYALSYLYTLAIVNSRLIGWLYRHKFQISEADTFPQIMIRDILQLPFPRPDKSRHDKMVSLVQTMLELNKALQKAKTPDEQTALQRQITATDNQIDQLVYQLYNLTEEEINIVEGATK